MATVTSYTAGRMLAIENTTVIGGSVVGDNLILQTREGTQISAGNVRGPAGPPGSPNPVGTLLMGGWATDPAGYWILDGRTVNNGAISYPDLAAIFPAWVSGNNLILPNTLDTVPRLLGSDAVSQRGVVSGSMTHTLSTSQLPVHSHSVPTHGHTIGSHTHNAVAAPNHDHTWPDAQQSYVMHSASYYVGEGLFQVWSGGTNPGGSTAVQLAYITDASGAANSIWPDGAHNHAIEGSGTLTTSTTGSSATGPIGSGSSIDHRPRNITVTMAVKY